MEKINIALVDDNPGFSELFKERLTRPSSTDIEYVVDCFDKFPDVFDYKYDIYLLDDNIYGRHESVDMINRIRKENDDAYIFVISGATDPEILKELLNLNIEGFIDKDFIKLDILFDAIRRLIKTKKITREIEYKLNQIRKIRGRDAL